MDIVDENQAKKIAENFLQQHYSIVNIESPVLNNKDWIVHVSVSEPKNRKFTVRINAKTGEVTSWQ